MNQQRTCRTHGHSFTYSVADGNKNEMSHVKGKSTEENESNQSSDVINQGLLNWGASNLLCRNMAL